MKIEIEIDETIAGFVLGCIELGEAIMKGDILRQAKCNKVIHGWGINFDLDDVGLKNEVGDRQPTEEEFKKYASAEKLNMRIKKLKILAGQLNQVCSPLAKKLDDSPDIKP